MVYVVSFLLLLIGLIAVALQRLYSAVPARELKRLASQGDALAQKVYQPVAFGVSLRLLLWLVAAPSLAFGFLVLARGASFGLSVFVLLVALALMLVWLPTLALTSKSAQLAVWFAPMMAWILQRTDPLLQSFARVLNRRRQSQTHSRLYEKADVQELLERQKLQPDNRIAEDELERAQRALTFSDKRAADIVTPRKKFRAVEAHEALGPVLLDELHASKQRMFIVFDGRFDHIVGVLGLSDALKAKQGGEVAGAMRPSVTYVHESFTLPEVLAALTSSGQQLAVVVNVSEEIVGVVTLDNLVHELTGNLPDEGIAYDDRASVAASRETFEKPKEPETKGELEIEASSQDVLQPELVPVETTEEPSEPEPIEEIQSLTDE
ncbi:MAG TPA: CBS domain-containing protein [Candidatus Saccharimonadales bacterium]